MTVERRLFKLSEVVAEACEALTAVQDAAEALPEPVRAYFAAYAVEPPPLGPWRPWPGREGDGTSLRAVYAHAVGCLYAQVAVTLPRVQMDLLVHAHNILQWHIARAHWPADDRAPGPRLCLPADMDAASRTLFSASNAHTLLLEHWHDPALWLALWRERGNHDPEVLAVCDLGPAELALLDA